MLFGISMHQMIGFSRGPYVAYFMICQAALQAVTSITLALLHFGALAPILGLIVGYTGSAIYVLTVLLTKFKVRFRKPSLGYMRKLLGFSSPILVYNGLRGLITNLAPIVLGLFATEAVVGNFGVAIKTGAILGGITDAFGLVLLPMFAYTFSTKTMTEHISKFYNHAVYMTYVLITPALFYLAIFSKQFSFTAFSSQYLLAPTYITIISIGTFIWIVATYTVMLLIGTNRIRSIMKYSVIIALIELLVLFTIVPMFKGIGVTVMLYIITPSLISLFMLRGAGKLLR